jgi:hypothetical protein
MQGSDEGGWESSLPAWNLVTSHGLALLFVATHPNATVQQIAEALGLSERRIADIIRELAAERLILVKRNGRRNEYEINPDARFRHPLVADIPFRAFIQLWRSASDDGTGGDGRNSGRGAAGR